METFAMCQALRPLLKIEVQKLFTIQGKQLQGKEMVSKGKKKWWPTLLNLVSLRGYRNRVNLLLDDFCRVESIKIKKHTKNLT